MKLYYISLLISQSASYSSPGKAYCPLAASKHFWLFAFYFMWSAMTVCETNSLANYNTKPVSLPPNVSLCCYARCLAKCADELGRMALNYGCATRCASFKDDKLCNSSDKPCWSTCKGLSSGNDSIPKAPVNVSVDFIQYPQPTPYEADVVWHSLSSNVKVFIVQYADATGSFDESLRTNVNVTSLVPWRFSKPKLCSSYIFRVAAVTSAGVSPFSETAFLDAPKPLVPTPFYDLISAELINEPFDFEPVSMRWNQTIRVLISFAPPPNWDLQRDITDITADVYPEASGSFSISYPPQKKWLKGTSEFELRLPGVDADKLAFKMIFSIDKIKTKCDNATNDDSYYKYPSLVYNPSRRMLLPVYEFELTCKDVLNTVCPYNPRDALPACGVNKLLTRATHENNTNLVTVNVTFDRLLEKRREPMLYYRIEYGEGRKLSQNSSGFDPPALEKYIGGFDKPNSTTTFQLVGLTPGISYVVYICGIYNRNNVLIDHDFASRYLIDLSPFHADAGQSHKNRNVASLTLIITAPLLAASLVAAAVVIIIWRRSRRETPQCREHSADAGVEITNDYTDHPRRHDRWEIPRRRLVIHTEEKLGSGAFGLVCKGRVLGELFTHKDSRSRFAEDWMKAENCVVAVKMLPDYADQFSKDRFRAEISSMKQIGYNEHLVNMLGCITDTEPLCLILEYCSHGDLLKYLRGRKTYMLQLQARGVDLTSFTLDETVDVERILTYKDLASIAWQISVGMEYLSQKGYMHRDLAARNVLIDNEKCAKIGDFGLCRHITTDTIYVGKGGRLPMKWMALEALKSCEFTTKSDVWSYGIVLYELFTLGDAPYIGLDPSDLEAYLESGCRMKLPATCPLEIYKIMLDCWRASPESRPSFTLLREEMRGVLESIVQDYYYVQVLHQSGQEKAVSCIQAPAIHSCSGASHNPFELDDQVFENESEVDPAAVPQKSRLTKTSSVTSAHQSSGQEHLELDFLGETPSSSGEEQLKEERSGNKNGTKFKYLKFTPSLELASVPEEDRAHANNGAGGAAAAVHVEATSPVVRRRSSTTSTSQRFT